MNTQQQAYINGFVKRASEYGLNQNEAIELLKQSADAPPVVNTGTATSTPPAAPAPAPVAPAKPGFFQRLFNKAPVSTVGNTAEGVNKMMDKFNELGGG
jgi:hypothetical protein